MKKIILLLLVTTMLFSSITLAYGKEPVYIALGDSITAGYGLESTDLAYPKIFADKRQLALTNQGVSGMTGSELLESIKANEDISKANIITVSIGSNNLLQPLMRIIAENIGLDLSTVQGDTFTAIKDRIMEIYDNGKGSQQLQSTVNSMVKVLTGNQELYNAADNFAQVEFPAIINEIRAKNPNAQIYVTDIYNPYTDVTISVPVDTNVSAYIDLGVICQPYVNRINLAFTNPQDYTLINVSDIFASRLLTNVTKNITFDNINTASLDPHPNFAGHSVIGTLIANAYKGEFLYGDADSNGVLAANDSAKILQYVLNKTAVTMTEEELIKSDVNNDGIISAADSADVLQKVLVNTYLFNVEK